MALAYPIGGAILYREGQAEKGVYGKRTIAANKITQAMLFVKYLS
jgi:hypothetical protein